MEPPVPGPQADIGFVEVELSAPPAAKLEFPEPVVHRAQRGPGLIINPETGERQVLNGIIYRVPPSASNYYARDTGPSFAYYPQKQLQEAIFGSVWSCIVLERHHGPATEEAARAAGRTRNGPYVWEVTQNRVAIKMLFWARIERARGRSLEDPVKEIAAMQLLGIGDDDEIDFNEHGRNHVLASIEVLSDDDFLYGVMPYCAGGDLFGIVVQHADDNGGECGMSEPVARYWFRQILVGLDFLQSRGVCHRDLSLENILVHNENSLIIDMGMCLRIPFTDPRNPNATTDIASGTMRRLMKPDGTCGKHNYMSPEVFANTEPFDGYAIDLWSVGVILYIMLTGFPPYDQASLADPRFDVIVNGRLTDQLFEWGVHLSDDVGSLLQNMLQLDPRNRLTLDQVMRHPWVTFGEVQPPIERAQPWNNA